MNLDRSTVTRSRPFRSDPRAQGARSSGDHKVEGQWLRGGRSLTGISPEFGRRCGLARRRLLRAQRDDADSDGYSSFTAVARIDDTVFLNSDSVPAITVLSSAAPGRPRTGSLGRGDYGELERVVGLVGNSPWSSNSGNGFAASGELYRALWPKLARASLLLVDWGGVEGGVRSGRARGRFI